MTDEQTKELYTKFPNLYRQRTLTIFESMMSFGFECGSGWFNLIHDLSEQLEKMILALPEKDRRWSSASQVKEKYGTLRFYMSSSTDEMDKAIEAAEKRSAKTCEQCGEPGRLRGRGWYYTACGEHTDEMDQGAN